MTHWSCYRPWHLLKLARGAMLQEWDRCLWCRGLLAQPCCRLSSGQSYNICQNKVKGSPGVYLAIGQKSLRSSSLKLQPAAAFLEACTGLDTAWLTGIMGKQTEPPEGGRVDACTEGMTPGVLCVVCVYLWLNIQLFVGDKETEFFITFQFCASLQPKENTQCMCRRIWWKINAGCKGP